jgi:hypothetical protein
MTSSRFATGRVPAPAAAQIEEKLAWDAFSPLYFPESDRHDLEAVAAYGAYRRGRDWQNSSSRPTSPPRLTLVPDELTLSAIEADSRDAAAERLLVAVAAEQVW